MDKAEIIREDPGYRYIFPEFDTKFETYLNLGRLRKTMKRIGIRDDMNKYERISDSDKNKIEISLVFPAVQTKLIKNDTCVLNTLKQLQK